MSQRVARLHRVGLKATGPRMVILSALEQDHGHPTAEQLYETLRQEHPSLSLSTIYQTLDVFIRTGLCRRVSGPGDRLRVDGTPAVLKLQPVNDDTAGAVLNEVRSTCPF